MINARSYIVPLLIFVSFLMQHSLWAQGNPYSFDAQHKITRPAQSPSQQMNGQLNPQPMVPVQSRVEQQPNVVIQTPNPQRQAQPIPTSPLNSQQINSLAEPDKQPFDSGSGNFDTRIQNMKNALQEYEYKVSIKEYSCPSFSFSVESIFDMKKGLPSPINTSTQKILNPQRCFQLYFKIIFDNLSFPQYGNNSTNIMDKEFRQFVETSVQYNPLARYPIKDSKGTEIYFANADKNRLQRDATRIVGYILWHKDMLEYHYDWDKHFLKFSYNKKLVRQKAYHDWYFNQYLKQDTLHFNENESVNSNFRSYIFTYFINKQTVMPKEEVDTAKQLLAFMKKNWGITVLDEEDCKLRPYYVIGCFFDFVSISHRVHGDETLQGKLAEFLPVTPDEFFKQESWAKPFYFEDVPEAIRQWLINRFAYPKKELEGKNLKELLPILQDQLQKVQPYHRYWKEKLENDKELASFLERFLKK